MADSRFLGVTDGVWPVNQGEAVRAPWPRVTPVRDTQERLYSHVNVRHMYIYIYIFVFVPRWRNGRKLSPPGWYHGFWKRTRCTLSQKSYMLTSCRAIVSWNPVDPIIIHEWGRGLLFLLLSITATLEGRKPLDCVKKKNALKRADIGK